MHSTRIPNKDAITSNQEGNIKEKQKSHANIIYFNKQQEIVLQLCQVHAQSSSNNHGRDRIKYRTETTAISNLTATITINHGQDA